MKKILFFFVAAVAGMVAYLLNAKKTSVNTNSTGRTHHLTNAFSKAKKHAIDS